MPVEANVVAAFFAAVVVLTTSTTARSRHGACPSRRCLYLLLRGCAMPHGGAIPSAASNNESLLLVMADASACRIGHNGSVSAGTRRQGFASPLRALDPGRQPKTPSNSPTRNSREAQRKIAIHRTSQGTQATALSAGCNAGVRALVRGLPVEPAQPGRDDGRTRCHRLPLTTIEAALKAGRGVCSAR